MALFLTASFSASMTVFTGVSVKMAEVLFRRPLSFAFLRAPALGNGRRSSSGDFDDEERLSVRSDGVDGALEVEAASPSTETTWSTTERVPSGDKIRT